MPLNVLFRKEPKQDAPSIFFFRKKKQKTSPRPKNYFFATSLLVHFALTPSLHFAPKDITAVAMLSEIAKLA